jgi:hypothetical protein
MRSLYLERAFSLYHPIVENRKGEHKGWQRGGELMFLSETFSWDN